MVTVAVNLGEASKFVKYSNDKLYFSPWVNDTGTYTI